MKKPSIGLIILCIVVLNVLGAASAVGSSPNSEWFVTIQKPWFQPPNWLFGPVWTVLYSCMGFASAYIIAAAGGKLRLRAAAAMAIQLALNMAWSPLFFAMHRIDLALLTMPFLIVAIVVTIWLVSKIKPLAAYLLLPYLGWVCFATYLTFVLWELNMP